MIYHSQKRARRCLCAIVACVLAFESSLHADIITLSAPFNATATETFDEFQPGYVGTINIFGGQATLSGGSGDSNDSIWQNRGFESGGFGLGPFSAQAQSGNQGYGNSLATSFNVITFHSGVTSFGGYWGSAVGGGPINYSFYGQSGNLIGTESFTYASPGNDGTLEWQGWSSTTPIYSIDYSGAWVVNDSLEMSTAQLPEAMSPFAGITILSSAFAGLIGIRKQLA